MLPKIASRFLLIAAIFMMALGSSCSDEKGLKIKSISPKVGPANGNNRVTIHGNGFSESMLGIQGIYFGDNQARFTNFDGDNKMMVVAPAGTVKQKVDVLIRFTDGRELTMPEAYTYNDPKAGFGIDALAPTKE